ncbi:MATE family efflux transporter [Selenomonas sp. KH1T6]|uniref:MATE family efflux transporter n=1 Tax=Selenomonas sp. KH1T6 TaxID=3158784 RepID=UPI0008A7CA94|nr:putative efflux protein, MATE family [Selenomonas ruminantium]
MNPVLSKSSALVTQKFREFFWPTVLATMAMQIGTILDSIIVGNMLGADAMAGVGVCMPLTQILGAFSFLLTVGAGSMIAVAAGARQKEEANRIFSAVLILNGLAAVVFLLILAPLLHEVAAFLAGEEKIAALAYEYLDVMIWYIPFAMFAASGSILVRTDGMAKLASQGVLLSQLVNVGLDLLLIGSGMGLTGAAVATVAGTASGMAWIGWRYFRTETRMLYFVGMAGSVRQFAGLARSLVQTGFPVASGMGLISLKVWCIYRILGMTGGADAMAIYTVCMSCLSLLSLVMGGCQGAMVPVLGMLYGERDYLGVRMLVRYVMRFSMRLAGGLVIILVLFPQEVLALFNISPSLYESGSVAIRLFSVSLIGVTLTFLLMYYYMTVGQKTAANLLSWVEGILVVVPAAWLLVQWMGLTGVWAAFVLAEVAGFAVLFVYIKRLEARDSRAFPDFFLIPQSTGSLLYDVSVQAAKENAVTLSKSAVKALRQSGMAEDIAIKAGVALEEMAVNLASRDAQKESSLDIRINKNETGVVIALRDNGAPFNPMEYTAGEKSQYLTDGIMLLKALAKDIKYSRVLSLNQTLIEI